MQLIVGGAVALFIAPTVIYNWWHGGASGMNSNASPGRALKAEMDRIDAGEMLTAEMSEVSMPVLLWWTPFSATKGRRKCPMGRRKKKEPEVECLFVSDRRFAVHPMAKAVLFYGSDFEPSAKLPLPRHRDQSWALLHEESPKNTMLFNHAPAIELFNHTATFRRASDLPLTLQHLSGNSTLLGNKFTVSLEEKNRLRREEPGLAAVAYLQSNCDNPVDRDAFVFELMRHLRVDSYGECMNNKPTMDRDEAATRRLLAKYKFVIAVENAACSDYVTEKLWRALEVGTVPIYHGAENVRDYLPRKKSAILVRDFKNVSELANHIKMLDANDKAYMEYLGHKDKTRKKRISSKLLRYA